jgi:hypothetical protein
MKKSLIATLLAGMFVSTAAFAGAQITFEGEYEHVTNKTNADVTGLNIIPAYKFDEGFLKGVTLDLKAQLQDKVDSHTPGQNIEPRVKYELPIGITGLTAWGRVGLGEKITNGDNFGYYTIEPGLTYGVTDKIKLSVSDRYRDAFASGKAYQTNTVYVGGAYKATDVDTIGLKVYEKYEDTHSTGVELGYTRSF